MLSLRVVTRACVAGRLSVAPATRCLHVKAGLRIQPPPLPDWRRVKGKTCKFHATSANSARMHGKITPGGRRRVRLASGTPSQQKPEGSFLPLKGFATGALAGAFGSWVGLGGAFVSLPFLTMVLKLTQHQAHATSLCAITATGLAGVRSAFMFVVSSSMIGITQQAIRASQFLSRRVSSL